MKHVDTKTLAVWQEFLITYKSAGSISFTAANDGKLSFDAVVGGEDVRNIGAALAVNVYRAIRDIFARLPFRRRQL